MLGVICFCCLFYDRDEGAQVTCYFLRFLFELLLYEIVLATNDGGVDRSELAADQNNSFMWFLDIKCSLISNLQPGFMLPPDFLLTLVFETLYSHARPRKCG